jgi:hypothetical protein
LTLSGAGTVCGDSSTTFFYVHDVFWLAEMAWIRQNKVATRSSMGGL